jgi:hypothetical protein
MPDDPITSPDFENLGSPEARLLSSAQMYEKAGPGQRRTRPAENETI